MATPGMLETKDWARLRQLNLVLLRQLRVGQDAVRRSVAKAASGVSAHLEGSRGRRVRGGGRLTRPEARPQVQRAQVSDEGKTEARRGRAWPGHAEAGAGMRTQAFVPSAGQLGAGPGCPGDLASLFQSAWNSSSSCDSQEASSMAPRASSLQDTHQGDPCDMSRPGGASSGVTFLPPATHRHRPSLGSLRPCSAPSLAVSDPDDTELSGELDSPGPQEAQAQTSILGQQSRLSKVTRENGTSLNFSFPV